MPSVEKPAEASSKGTGKIGKEETEDEESTGWFSTQLSAVGSQLAAKIVNSIQVFVEDIHIRIEDDRDPNVCSHVSFCVYLFIYLCELEIYPDSLRFSNHQRQRSIRVPLG